MISGIMSGICPCHSKTINIQLFRMKYKLLLQQQFQFDVYLLLSLKYNYNIKDSKFYAYLMLEVHLLDIQSNYKFYKLNYTQYLHHDWCNYQTYLHLKVGQYDLSRWVRLKTNRIYQDKRRLMRIWYCNKMSVERLILFQIKKQISDILRSLTYFTK